MSTNRQRGPAWLDDYVGVDARLIAFRAAHPKARIITQILEREPLTFRAEIFLEDNDTALPNAVGHASVDGGSGNRSQSPTEKTETAAIGRALTVMGFEGGSEESGERATEMQKSARMDADTEQRHLKVAAPHTTPAQPSTAKGGVPPNVTISQAIQQGAKATDADDVLSTAQIALVKRAAAAPTVNVDPEEECRRVFQCEVQQLSKTGALALINHLKAGAPDKWA